MRIKIKFDPRDLWIGVYWTRSDEVYLKRVLGEPPEGPHPFRWFRLSVLRVYVCILPTLPIVFTFGGRKSREPEQQVGYRPQPENIQPEMDEIRRLQQIHRVRQDIKMRQEINRMRSGQAGDA